MIKITYTMYMCHVSCSCQQILNKCDVKKKPIFVVSRWQVYLKTDNVGNILCLCLCVYVCGGLKNVVYIKTDSFFFFAGFQ